MSHGGANEVFPMTRGTDAASTVVCVGSGTDDWRVSNPTVALISHASGRGACGDGALLIKRNSAYGAEFTDFKFVARVFRCGDILIAVDDSLQLASTPFGMEVAVVDHL